MKKTVSVLALFYMMAIALITANSQAARNAEIPPGTKARLVLQSRLSTKLNEVGDRVVATLHDPVYINGLLVMPRDAEFHGRITAVKPAGRAHKSGQMTILLDRVLAPWGEEPVEVVITAIDDWDNEKKLKADDEGSVDGGHRGKETADNVIRGGGIGASGAGTATIIGRGRSGRRTNVAGGTAMAGGMVAGLLLTKGGDIRLEPGAILRIEFLKPLKLPVIEERIP